MEVSSYIFTHHPVSLNVNMVNLPTTDRNSKNYPDFYIGSPDEDTPNLDDIS